MTEAYRFELAQRNYRKFTAQQKLEIVLAGLRGDRSVRDVCREHEIAETLYYSWRKPFLKRPDTSSHGLTLGLCDSLRRLCATASRGSGSERGALWGPFALVLGCHTPTV